MLLTAIRNTVVARALGPEQFGMAVTFLLMQQFIDTTTETGLNKFLLQNRMGNRPSMQAMVQTLAAVRGLVIACILLLVAWPLSSLLGHETSAVPFVMLSVMAISMGLLHFDNWRLQRNHLFFNNGFSSMVSETVSLLAVLAALWFTRSYLVALLAVTIRATACTITSHLLAHRRYLVRYSAALAPTVFAFSWPLFFNGPLLFFSSQADRLIVNAVLGLRELGIYSAALLLLYLPLGLIMRVVGSVFAPKLATAHHAQEIEPVETEYAGTVLAACLLAACGFAAIGPWVLVLLYGPAYSLHGLPVALIGLMHAVRSMRSWPVGIALATGHTSNLLVSNLVRLLALPIGFAGALVGDGIVGLTGGLLVGEVIALLISLVLLNRNRGLVWWHHMSLVGIAFAAAAVLTLAYWLLDPRPIIAAAIATLTLAVALGSLHLLDRRLLPRNLAAFGW